MNKWCYSQDCKRSGKRGSNPRPSAWEADALPLSYYRSIVSIANIQHLFFIMMFFHQKYCPIALFGKNDRKHGDYLRYCHTVLGVRRRFLFY